MKAKRPVLEIPRTNIDIWLDIISLGGIPIDHFPVFIIFLLKTLFNSYYLDKGMLIPARMYI